MIDFLTKFILQYIYKINCFKLMSNKCGNKSNETIKYRVSDNFGLRINDLSVPEFHFIISFVEDILQIIGYLTK